MQRPLHADVIRDRRDVSDTRDKGVRDFAKSSVSLRAHSFRSESAISNV